MKVTIVGKPDVTKALEYIADKIKREMKEVNHDRKTA
jgi:hypothetical protein